ncbi:MAG: phosphoribosylformylglycinamidine cyclo-ligase [bacterium]
MTEKKVGMTYAAAGVNIRAGYEAVRLLAPHARRTYRPEVLNDIGGFGGLFQLAVKYKEPVLVSGTDGVGTKLKIAFLTGRHDTVGQDAVAYCVNDVAVAGAEVLFFLDYIGIGKLVPEKVAAIVKGVADGCELAGCALIGGETAELPGFYAPDEYDLVGFAVGVAEKAELIDGSAIRPGDAIIGIASSGLHSSGYSLVRKVLFEMAGYRVGDYLPELDKTLGDELLTPTKIYVRQLMELREKVTVRGIANITGGGFYENIPRILPAGTGAIIRRDAWSVPTVFRLVEKAGAVTEREMYGTLNMGIGMVVIVPPAEAAEAVRTLTALGEKAYIIGEVKPGDRSIEIV